MKIYLAGGYLKPTGDNLIKYKAHRLFSFYDLLIDRFLMITRLKELIEELKK